MHDIDNASETMLNSDDHDAEKAADSNNAKVEVPSEQSAVMQVDSSDLSSIHDQDIGTEKANNDVDVYTFNFWNDAHGNIVEAVNYIEEKLHRSFTSHNIKEEDRYFRRKVAKVMQDGDIHVGVLFKKKMRAVALGIQTTYVQDKAAEISFVGVNL